MVTELAEMMVERLQEFKSKSNVLPTRIIVYRDGVSEVCALYFCFNCGRLTEHPQGQFNTVVREEMPQIRQAFTKFNVG